MICREDFGHWRWLISGRDDVLWVTVVNGNFLSAHDEFYYANALDAETNRPILLVSSVMDETFECRRTAKRVLVVLHRIGSLEDLHDW